jgi:hypothetical protein
MKKIHVAAIALLLGLAMVLGTFAATRTASLGTASRHAGTAAYTARVKQLDAFSAKLRRELAAKPAQVQQAPATPAATPRIVYRRPPAVVVVKHTHHGDDGFERANGGGGND